MQVMYICKHGVTGVQSSANHVSIFIVLSLKVPATATDALRHFETG